MTGRRKPPKTNPEDNVIALDDFRDRLRRDSRSRRAETLFASADPEGAIRALPSDEFFYVIHELGFPEAMDVFVHATAEQVQTVLDFSVWERDRVDLDKAGDWLAAMAEAPPKKLGEWAQGIDVELLALLVRRRARIFDLSMEEAPEETEGTLWPTPDRLFVVEILGEPEQVRVTQRLLDTLYRYSPNMMRRLLVGMRAEVDAELEEAAFRWRSGRMADLGFVDFHEALAVYQEIDPTKVVIGPEPAISPRPLGEPASEAHARLPMVMSERLTGKTPFARAVAALASPAELADLHYALVALSNRALSADRVTPGDDDAVRHVLERVSATLDLAVEFLARGNTEREVAAIRSIPLLTLHQLGVSLVGKLRRLAQALRTKNPFAALRPAIDIFDAEDAEVLASLARLRPLFPRSLDAPPAAGERAFATLADLTVATRAVERAAAALEILTALGIKPAHLVPDSLAAMASEAAHPGEIIDPATIDAGTLARTVLVHRLLGHPPGPVYPLSPEAIEEFGRKFNDDAKLIEDTMLSANTIIRDSLGAASLEGARREVTARWLSTLHPLGPVLGPTPRSVP